MAARDQVAQRLLSARRADGTIATHPYAKWYGAHWVLVMLAEVGHRRGDPSLQPLLGQDLDWLESADYTRSLGRVKGLPRMHASIDANAIWAAERLGLADERLPGLVERVLDHQWPDGGWNCDRDASGRSSSFTESLIPLRAMALWGRNHRDRRATAAAGRAAEFFLARRLLWRRSDGRLVHRFFDLLHFPCYWHYDFLFGLQVMAEAGHVRDPRCSDALDLLESKRLPDGGWPAEARYYRTGGRVASGLSPVDWGGVSSRRANPYVTARAREVLKAAGRR